MYNERAKLSWEREKKCVRSWNFLISTPFRFELISENSKCWKNNQWKKIKSAVLNTMKHDSNWIVFIFLVLQFQCLSHIQNNIETHWTREKKKCSKINRRFIEEHLKNSTKNQRLIHLMIDTRATKLLKVYDSTVCWWISASLRIESIQKWNCIYLYQLLKSRWVFILNRSFHWLAIGRMS